MTEAGDISQSPDIDARYVAARRVLLDSLTALTQHGSAVILAGAQTRSWSLWAFATNSAAGPATFA
jgi:hypothetical protein